MNLTSQFVTLLVSLLKLSAQYHLPRPTKRNVPLTDHPLLTDPIGYLRALDRSLGHFINVLLWQVEQAIERALVVLEVAATVGIEDSGEHDLCKPHALACPHLLDAAGVPLPSGLVGDGPVVFPGARHAKSGLQHVFLADGEGLHIDHLVLQVLKAGFFVRAFGLDGQTEQSGDGATDLS